MTATTPCDCPMSGYCNRHRRTKPGRLFRLCQTDQRYFDLFEQQTHGKPELAPSVKYNHWAPLHFYAIKNWDDWNPKKAQVWYRKWKRDIPKTGCGCGNKWKRETGIYPPQFKTAKAFFEWAWLVHDAVNERLGKPRASLKECYAIWGSSLLGQLE